MKKILLGLSLIFLFNCAVVYAAAPTSSSTRIKVDGISGNTNIVINGRKPVFSWDFTFSGSTDQDTVAIQIGTAAGSSDVWSYSGVLLVSYKVYDGTTDLAAGTTYYWQIRITNTDSETSDWILSTFHTVNAGVSLSSSGADLKIDWNNPFNPKLGQVTRVRYQLTDSNEEVKVRVYTINGELVKTLAEHLAQQNALYTVDWDGKNAEGEFAASGVYLVNLKAGTSINKTRRVVVIK